MPLTRREVVQTASLGTVLASFLKATPAVSAPTAGQGTRIVNLDDRVAFKQQLEHNIGPAVLMSTFLVPPDQVDNFLEGFKKQFAIMRKQPGLISAQLHRGVAGQQPVHELHRLGIDRRLQARLRVAGISGAVEAISARHGRLRQLLSEGRHTRHVRRRGHHRRAVTRSAFLVDRGEKYDVIRNFFSRYGARREIGARYALIAVRTTVAELFSKISDRLTLPGGVPMPAQSLGVAACAVRPNSLRCCIPTRGRWCSAQLLAPWSSWPASHGRKFLESP